MSRASGPAVPNDVVAELDKTKVITITAPSSAPWENLQEEGEGRRLSLDVFREVHMIRRKYFSPAMILAGILLQAGWLAVGAASQSVRTHASTQPTVDQQKQLDELRQLDGQLQKDRDALYDVVDKYGWDSDEADAAQEQLIRDRAQYRRLRGSLEAAGVTIPLPSTARSSRAYRNGSWMGHRGRGHHGCCWDDDDHCGHGYHDGHCCGGR